jgi:hypothetical protein
MKQQWIGIALGTVAAIGCSGSIDDNALAGGAPKAARSVDRGVPAECSHLHGIAGTYVNPAFHYTLDAEDALQKIRKQPPPSGTKSSVILVSVLPEGKMFSLAWVAEEKGKFGLRVRETPVDVKAAPAVVFSHVFGGHSLRLTPGESGSLVVTSTEPKGKHYDDGFPWQGEMLTLQKIEHGALCEQTSQCETLVGKGSVCSSNEPLAETKTCVPRESLRGRAVRDDLIGSYVLPIYANRRFDRDFESLPREGTDAPQSGVGMLTLLPNGKYHALWWVPAHKSIDRVAAWIAGSFDVIQRGEQVLLYLDNDMESDFSATGRMLGDTPLSEKFAVSLDRDQMTLTPVAGDKDDPFHLRLTGRRARKLGPSVTLVRHKDGVLCGTTSDCDAFFANGKKWVCASDAAHGMGWCMDVRDVPVATPPASSTELAGSYVKARLDLNIAANAHLLRGKKGEPRGTHMLTLLPDGKFQRIAAFDRSRFAHGDKQFETGPYTVEHAGGGTQLRLKLGFKRGTLYGVEVGPDGTLTLRLLESTGFDGKVTKLSGKPFKLVRTDRTSLCQKSSDCAQLSATNPSARWLCELHNPEIDDPIGACIDMAERGHETVLPRSECD